MMDDIILIKCYRGANFQPGEGYRKVMLGDTALRTLALETNFKVSRLEDEIVLYKAWHENGFVTLYVNNTKDKVLTELVEYNLENMIIDGLEGDKTVFVKVGPGEE